MSVETRVCRACGSVDAVPALMCADCGPSDGVYIRDHSGVERRVCFGCRRPISGEAGEAPANSCSKCGLGAFGWRGDSGDWASSVIQNNSQMGDRWIKAVFDGAYSGTGLSAASSLSSAPSIFELTVIDGTLRDACYVQAPPALTISGDVSPIRQNEVKAVITVPDFETSAASSETPMPIGLAAGGYRVLLKDFRLHDWRFVGVESTGMLGVKAMGRLLGTAYGRLDFPASTAPRPVERPAEPRLTVEPPIDERRFGTSTRASSSPPKIDCPSCSFGWVFILAGFLWWLCTWRAALVGGLSARLVCAVHSSLCRHRVGLYRLSEPLRTRLSMLFGTALVLLAIPVLIASISASSSATCGEWLPEQFFVLLGLLLASGLQTLLWPRWVLQALLIWALLAHCTSSVGACGKPLSGAGVSTSTGTVADSGTTVTDSDSDVSAIGGADQPPAPGADQDPAPGVAQSLQLAGQSLVNIYDSVSSAVTQATRLDQDMSVVDGLMGVNADGVKLVSIAQVVGDPPRYLGCLELPDGTARAEYSIYLGQDALFDRNSDVLKPDAMRSSLRDLLRLVSSRPELSWLIIGHTDSTGNDVINVPLSVARAESIANWLAMQGVPRERLETIGEGAAVPLVRPSASIEEGGYLAGISRTDINPEFFESINRRVEISVDCLPKGR